MPAPGVLFLLELVSLLTPSPFTLKGDKISRSAVAFISCGSNPSPWEQ